MPGMRRNIAVFAAGFLMCAVSVATQQQAPAQPPPATNSGQAAAGRGAQQQAVLPVAAGTVAAHPDRFDGKTVSMTATVAQRYGATAFSVKQAAPPGVSKSAPAQEILVVAPVLTGPLQPGAYVTVIGEVVKYDAAAVAARMKDAAPPSDVAARYAGRPAVLATSVISTSMVDLARKLPPPMSPGEMDLNKAMKQVGPAFNLLRQAVTASNTSDAKAQADALSAGFAEAAAFWKTQPHPEAVQWTDDARTLADELAMFAAKPDLDGLKADVPKLQQVCSNCHNQFRARLDDGSYRYKDALPK